MISEAALEILRDRNPIAEVADRFGVTLRRMGGALVGPCPICSANSGSRAATRFEIKPGGRAWVCAVCQDGGDVIRLVQLVEHKDFRGAVEWLGGAQEVDPAVAAKVARDKAERQARRDAESIKRREEERARLWGIWRLRGQPIAGSPVETYLAGRGLVLPKTAALRYLPEAVYFHGNERDERGRDRPRRIHTGPAMLAAIRRPDGKFGGLHFTYLAPDGHGKAAIADPDTGELLPAKKVRGSAKAGVIALVDPTRPEFHTGADGVVARIERRIATRVFWGEGIETVLSVAQALLDRGPHDAFYSAIDLGNLGGPHADQAPHPTEKTKHNHAKRVPGPTPDRNAPAAPMPATMRELVILRDGDSDPFLTDCAVARCAARYAGPNVIVREARPDEGADFNDMLQASQ